MFEEYIMSQNLLSYILSTHRTKMENLKHRAIVVIRGEPFWFRKALKIYLSMWVVNFRIFIYLGFGCLKLKV